MTNAMNAPSGLVLQALCLLAVFSLPALAENNQAIRNLPAGSSLSPGKDRAPVVRFEPDPTRARIPLLSWDTEGGDHARNNLLRTGSAVGLRVKLNGQWRGGEEFPTQVEPNRRGGDLLPPCPRPGGRYWSGDCVLTPVL